jgi:hypothetical protein
MYTHVWTTLFELQKLKNLNNTGRNKQNESTKPPLPAQYYISVYSSSIQVSTYIYDKIQ